MKRTRSPGNKTKDTETEKAAPDPRALDPSLPLLCVFSLQSFFLYFLWLLERRHRAGRPAKGRGHRETQISVFVLPRPSWPFLFFLKIITESFREKIDKAAAVIAALGKERDSFRATSQEEIAKTEASLKDLTVSSNRVAALADALEPLETFAKWCDYATATSSTDFDTDLANARGEIRNFLKHAGEHDLSHVLLEHLRNLDRLFGRVNHHAGFFITGANNFAAENPEHAHTALNTIWNVGDCRDMLEADRVETAQKLKEQRKKEDVQLRQHEEDIASWTARRDDYIKLALAAMPDVTPLLPELTKARLEAAPGVDCQICSERLGWPSDAVLLGRDNCHLAVMVKCCCQYVGESCARRLLEAPPGAKPKCPFCRAEPLEVDGSVNRITFV